MQVQHVYFKNHRFIHCATHVAKIKYSLFLAKDPGVMGAPRNLSGVSQLLLACSLGSGGSHGPPVISPVPFPEVLHTPSLSAILIVPVGLFLSPCLSQDSTPPY